ncbi:hypothetical protein HID58_043126, partial [Brassica napus]
VRLLNELKLNMEKYELVKDIGSGNFGVARLMRVKDSKELVAMKYIERGPKQICHRDLKLENTLLDGSPAPRLKICDFGYSKSSLLHSRPKSTVGTPAYIAPEVLSRREYDGKMADVWSCGVTLYVMLVGAYPFEDPEDPKNFRKTMQRILAVQYKIPDYVHISQDCKHILSHIFVANPLKRITIAEIKKHPWFLKNLPRELTEIAQAAYYRKENPTFSLQSVEEIMKIVEEAKTPPPVSRSIGAFGWGGEEDAEEVSEEVVEEDEEDEYDKTVKQVHASGEIRISFSCGFCFWKSCKICSRRDRLLPKVRHHLAQISSFLYSHSSNPLLKSNPHDLVPFIEGELSLVPQVDDVANDNGNTLFSTHISRMDCYPNQFRSRVVRWSDSGPLNTLEESFDMFCRGFSFYGPYLDHVMSYWNAYQENPDQILFLKYETIRADTLPYVKRLAEFMGYGFTAEEEKKGVVEEVVNLCSFETLKNLEANKGEKDREGTEGREDIPSNFYPKSHISERERLEIGATT